MGFPKQRHQNLMVISYFIEHVHALTIGPICTNGNDNDNDFHLLIFWAYTKGILFKVPISSKFYFPI